MKELTHFRLLLSFYTPEKNYLCAIWYHLQACDFTKSNTPRLVFLTFFKLNKWYQIAQSILNEGENWRWTALSMCSVQEKCW